MLICATLVQLTLILELVKLLTSGEPSFRTSLRPILGKSLEFETFSLLFELSDSIADFYLSSFYGAPIDSSTATNRGQGDLKVTWSRGYVRNQLLKNGGFEGDAGKDWIFAGGKSKATGKNLVGYYINEPHYSHAAGEYRAVTALPSGETKEFFH